MKTKKIILFSAAFVGLAVAALPLMNRTNTNFSMASAADDGYFGNWYWDGINCTVKEYSNKGAEGYATDPGFYTEIIPDSGAKNVRVTLNQTVKGSVAGSSGEQMFGFTKPVDADGNVVAAADMIVITLKNAKDLTKSISVVNRVHSGVWNAVGVSFTDDLEYRNDGYVYIKGTNQAVMGNNSGTYNKVGLISGGNKANAPLWGCDYFYINVTSSGDVRHNQYSIYANILNGNFLANSRANLDESSPYYNRYTTEYAQSILTALSDSYNVLQVTYYNVHASNNLGFRMTQVGNEWLGTKGNKKPSMTYPFNLPKQDNNFKEPVLYAGGSYTVGSVIETHNRLAKSDGFTTEITGWNDAANHNNDTWFGANQLSKSFSKETPGIKGITTTTKCNLTGQSWSDRYTVQDIYFDFLDGTPTVTAVEDAPKTVYGEEYDLSQLFEVYAPVTPVTYVYEVDGVVDADGKIIGDGLDHEIKLTVTDSETSPKSASSTVDLKHTHRLSLVQGQAETCTADGFKDAYQCDDCDLFYEDDKAATLIGDVEAYAAWKLNGGKIPAHAHTLNKVDGKAATCLEDGFEDAYQCEECDNYFEDDQAATLIGDGEDYEAWKVGDGKIAKHVESLTLIEGQAETCTADGFADAYQCDSCKKYYEDNKAETLIGDGEAYEAWKVGDGKIPAHAHTLGKVDGQAETCTADGFKDAYKCSECNQYFEDDKAATLIGDAEAYAAWKLDGGKIAKHPHSISKVDGQAETCTADGFKDAYKCSECNQYFEDNKAETLIGDAEAYAAWKLNGGKIPAHAHTLGKVDGQAETCTADGFKDAYKCSECNQYFEDDKAATLIGDAEAYAAWKLDGGKIPAHAHTTSKKDGLAPTCVLPGYKDYYQCSECNGFFEDQAATTPIADLDAWKLDGGSIPVNPDAHHLVKVDGLKETCTTAGYKDYYQCDRLLCGACFEDAEGKVAITNLEAWKLGDGKIAPHAHTTSKVDGQAPTCSEAGWKDYYKCSECNGFFEDQAATTPIESLELWKLAGGAIPADPSLHSLKKVDGKAATCTEAGWKDYYKCEHCDACFEDAEGKTPILLIEVWKVGAGKIDALGHHVVSVTGKAATCTEAGWKDYYKCDRCNALFEDAECKVSIPDLEAWKAGAGKLAPLGHEYRFVAEVPATKDKDGMKAHYECSGCDKLFVKEGEQYIEKTAADLVLKYQSSGCGGSIIAGSAVLCGLALAGAALIIAKRKKED